LTLVLVVAGEDAAGDHDRIALLQRLGRVHRETAPALHVDEQAVAVDPCTQASVEPAFLAGYPEVGDRRAVVQPVAVDVGQQIPDDGHLGLVHGALLSLRCPLHGGYGQSVQANETTGKT